MCHRQRSYPYLYPLPIPIPSPFPHSNCSVKGLSLMSLTSFLDSTKERLTLKRDGATSRHLVGYRIPMVDGRLSWKRHLLTTNVLSSCFFVLNVHTSFFIRTKSNHWWPSSSSLPKMTRFISSQHRHDQTHKCIRIVHKRP